MGDVADILGLSPTPKPVVDRNQMPVFKKRARPPPSFTPKKPTLKKKRTGLSRELAALQQSQPETTLAPSTPKPFKEKRSVVRKAERWMWRGFTSSARPDNAVFYHWAKLRDPVEDYPFANLNKRVAFLEYDDTEYDGHLISNTWTRTETNYLIQMCKLYDCRFIVIQDRWEMKPRTVEDIKDRFYSVQRKLIELGAMKTSDTNWKKHPLVKHPYNKEQEEDRKIQLECLFRRNKRQIQEEDEIAPKAHEILQTFNKHKEKASDVISLAQKIIQANVPETRRGGRGRGRGRGRASGASPGVSNTVNVKNPKMQAQINQTLQTLGVSKPDKNSKCSVQFNNLKNSLAVLFELEKLQNSALYELQVLKEQRKLLLLEKQRRSGQPLVKEEYTDQGEEAEMEPDQENEINRVEVDGCEIDSEVSTKTSDVEVEDESRLAVVDGGDEGDGDEDGEDGDEDADYVE